MRHDQAAFASANLAYRHEPMNRINRFMPLVRRLAWHMQSSSHPDLDVQDLVQTGLVALAECAQRHEHESEDGFAAYAKLRVRGAMVDLLRRSATISRTAMKLRRQVREKERALQQRLARAPTAVELSNELGISLNELGDIQATASPWRLESLEDCYSDHDPSFADQAPGGFEILCDAEAKERLGEALQSLEERHQLVIQLYFVEELNLAEIASVLNVSIPRVHQIKAQAIKALREKLAEEGAELSWL